MNRFYTFLLLSFLFIIFLSPAFGQLEWRNDTVQLNTMQNTLNQADYVTAENNWGKCKNHTGFDSILSKQFQNALDTLMAEYYMIGA